MAFKLLGGHHEYAHMQCKQLSNNEQGEVAASYRWTSWVWEIASWGSNLQEKYPSI